MPEKSDPDTESLFDAVSHRDAEEAADLLEHESGADAARVLGELNPLVALVRWCPLPTQSSLFLLRKLFILLIPMRATSLSSLQADDEFVMAREVEQREVSRAFEVGAGLITVQYEQPGLPENPKNR